MVAYSKNSQKMENSLQGFHAGGGEKIMPPHQLGAEGTFPTGMDTGPLGS